MKTGIRLSLGVFDHPKVKKLGKRLGADGVLALLRLWTWAAGNRAGGVLTGLDTEDVELVAEWEGEEGALVSTLLGLRLLDDSDGTFAIHDWEEHQTRGGRGGTRSGKAALSNAERQRRYRERQQGGNGVTDGITPVTRNVTDGVTDGVTPVTRNVTDGVTPVTRNVTDGVTPVTRNVTDGVTDGVTPVTRNVTDGVTDGVTPPPPDERRSDGPAKTDAPSRGHPQWPAFQSCWQVYPVRQGQEAAWREWMRLHDNGTLAETFTIRDAILRLKNEDTRWRQGMVPNMARWLNGKGWNDEPYVPPGGVDGMEKLSVEEINARASLEAKKRKKTFDDLRVQSERMRYGYMPEGGMQ